MLFSVSWCWLFLVTSPLSLAGPQRLVPITIGEVGKLLHESTATEAVIKRIKKHFGGLRALIENIK